nr:reverse transcriptase domain-containing protein [Tanacetum cinerariifolium]
MGVENFQTNMDSRLAANKVLVEELNEMSINEAEVLVVAEEEGDTWMTPIYNYLMEETLFVKKEKARAVRRKSGSMHARTRYVVAKSIRTGYYWPTMHTDARNLIQAWQDCQIEELSHVLWVHRTMIKSSNKDTTFLLTYETEAVIPTEIGMPTMRTAKVDMVQNDKALEINLDLLEERKEQAAIREAKSKEKIEKYYNFKVRNTSFKPRDLVYRSNEASHAKESEKLIPK